MHLWCNFVFFNCWSILLSHFTLILVIFTLQLEQSCISQKEPLHNLSSSDIILYVCLISRVNWVKCSLVTTSLISLASHQSVYLIPPLGVHTSNRDQVCVGTQAVAACLNPSSSVQTSWKDLAAARCHLPLLLKKKKKNQNTASPAP